MYDICILGAGPCGIALLNALHSKYNVIIIEEVQPFNSLKNFMINMVWHSPWRLCKLEDKNFSGVNIHAYPTIENLIQKYEEFIEEKNLKNKIIIDKVKEISNQDNLCHIKGQNNNYISRCVVCCTGSIKFPISVPFPIINSNVYRKIKDYTNIRNQNIVCIGGGYSSIDLSTRLNRLNNKIIILTRGYEQEVYNKLRTQNNPNHCAYTPGISHHNILPLHYNHIQKIENNKLFFDSKAIKFDKCYIFWGYNNAYTDIKLMSNIREKVYRISIDTIEELYGSEGGNEGGSVTTNRYPLQTAPIPNSINNYINNIINMLK